MKKIYCNVSVIIPHYNAISTIARSIDSVLNQSVSIKELIIVDDCSDEYNSLAKILDAIDFPFTLIVHRLDVNSGASEARNQAVSMATGKYVAFLDSDDVWHPKKLELQYELMESYNLSLSGHLYVQDLNNELMVCSPKYSLKSIHAFLFLIGNPFFTPTIMALRDGFIGFDSRYRRVDDYKCWLLNVKKSGGVLLKITLAGGFKPAIGSSGLTASYKVMHQSYLQVLRDMRQDRDIGISFWITAVLIEYAKYPMRFVKGNVLRFLRS